MEFFENPIVILDFFENSKIKNFESKLFFLKLKNIFDNSFDAEKAELSISGTFRTIRALSEEQEQISFFSTFEIRKGLTY